MTLLTIQEVVEIMKISESTVRRLIKSGALPAYKIGKRGQLRVKQEELEEYLEKQKVVQSTTSTMPKRMGEK